MTSGTKYSPRRGVTVGVAMCLGSFAGIVLFHGFPSTWDAWSDVLGRICLTVVVCALFELFKWRISRRAIPVRD